MKTTAAAFISVSAVVIVVLFLIKHFGSLIHLAVGDNLASLILELRLLHPRRHVIGDERADDEQPPVLLAK